MWESGFIQTEKDLRFSDELSKKAAEGDSEAQFQLGLCYARGFGIDKDYKKAVELWEKSSSQKNAKSKNALALAYLKGLGVPKNPQKAFSLLYENSLADDIDSLVDLGVLYSRGRGVQRDYAKAFQFYSKAAAQGNPRGLAQLGYLYYSGRGVSKDANKAVEYYRKAIKSEQGFGLAYLGTAYEEGQGVEKSTEKAIEMFQKAAEKGDPFAQWKLGNFYLLGTAEPILPKNEATAFQWYLKSAEQDNTLGINSLAYVYELGKGVEKNYENSFALFKKASEMGHAPAQANLARYYLGNFGCQKNLKEVFRLFSEASHSGGPSDTGWPEAQYQLALAYKNGTGTDIKLDLFEYWIQQAAIQGYPPAVLIQKQKIISIINKKSVIPGEEDLEQQQDVKYDSRHWKIMNNNLKWIGGGLERRSDTVAWFYMGTNTPCVIEFNHKKNTGQYPEYHVSAIIYGNGFLPEDKKDPWVQGAILNYSKNQGWLRTNGIYKQKWVQINRKAPEIVTSGEHRCFISYSNNILIFSVDGKNVVYKEEFELNSKGPYLGFPVYWDNKLDEYEFSDISINGVKVDLQSASNPQ